MEERGEKMCCSIILGFVLFVFAVCILALIFDNKNSIMPVAKSVFLGLGSGILYTVLMVVVSFVWLLLGAPKVSSYLISWNEREILMALPNKALDRFVLKTFNFQCVYILPLLMFLNIFFRFDAKGDAYRNFLIISFVRIVLRAVLYLIDYFKIKVVGKTKLGANSGRMIRRKAHEIYNSKANAQKFNEDAERGMEGFEDYYNSK